MRLVTRDYLVLQAIQELSEQTDYITVLMIANSLGIKRYPVNASVAKLTKMGLLIRIIVKSPKVGRFVRYELTGKPIDSVKFKQSLHGVEIDLPEGVDPDDYLSL